MPTNDAPFGFGKNATGAPAGTAATVITSFDDLVTKLTELGTAGAGPKLISIPAGEYDFTKQKELVIRAKQVTIQAEPQQRVVLKNITIRLDLANIDQILIQHLVFRSSGKAADGIRLFPADDSKPTTLGANFPASVRITHCSFDGYRDIAIDSRSSTAFPFLLATIDHCLFFDSNPGQPTSPPDANGKLPFVNRGAINIGSLEDPGRTGPNQPQLPSHSRVTIAYNAFIRVWRRCPRIATNNFGHIYNNIVFRWGDGNDNSNDSASTIATQGTDTWRCIEIGGGDGVTRGNNGVALIEANRFIPADLPGRDALDKTITIKTGTIVDIGAPPSPNQPNRFDDKNGVQRTVTFPAPAQGLSTVGQPVPRTTEGQPLADDSSPATPVNMVDWPSLVRQSGPDGTADKKNAEQKARKLLLDVLGPS